jgi:hypothetical protein
MQNAEGFWGDALPHRSKPDHKKNSGSIRSLYKVFRRSEASRTRPGFIVLAWLGQFLMQAQHVMHCSVSIALLFPGSIAPTGHPSEQIPHPVHASLTAIKSTFQNTVPLR